MKKFLFLILICCAALAQAQDTTLPQGTCRLQLFSGKTVKKIRLWKIANGTLEYLKDENLHDIPTSQVQMICTPAGDYVFADSALQKIQYDLIVLTNNDSIACTIKEVNSLNLLYTPARSAEERFVWRYQVKKYLLKGQENKLDEALYVQEKPVNTVKARPEIFSDKQDADYYNQGKADAKNEFKGNGSLAGGMLCGFFPVIGWIVAPITLAVDPRVDPQKKQLYDSSYAYQAGYQKEVRRKKRNRTLTGFAIGITALFVLIVH